MGWLSRALKRHSSSRKSSSSSSRKKSSSSSSKRDRDIGRAISGLNPISSAISNSISASNQARKKHSSSSRRSSSSNKNYNSTPSWQNKLNGYKTDHDSGYKEIDRAKSEYEKRKASGNMEGANAAHKWANQIRSAMGVSDGYDSQTGAKKNTSNVNKIQAPTYSKPKAPTVKGSYNPYTGQYADTINNVAKQYGLDPNLIASVITRESSFNPNITSKAGAGGLMQLMPKTASGLGVNNIYDPIQNINGGTKYLKQMIDRAGGDINKALAYYNAGPNRKQIPGESIQYANNVLETFKGLTGQRYGSTQSQVPQQPQKPDYEQKMDSYVNDKEGAMAERKRVIDVMNSGQAKDMGAAKRYLKQLDTIIRGGSVQDALGGNYNLPTNDNEYAMSLDQRSRLEYYRNNPEAYEADVNRTLDKLEYGEAENPQQAESWLNRIDWAKEGADIEDIVAGKYDNQEAYPEEETEPAMAMGGDSYYEEQLSEKDQIIEELRKLIEEQPDVEEIYDDLMDTYDSQAQRVPDVPSYSEALRMAQDQLNPLYDQSLKGALSAVDNNNLQRGFFGQMPGAELERSTAADIEGRRNSALSSLANSLINQSRDYSQSIIDSNMRDQQNELSTLLKSLGMKFDLKNGHMGNLADLLKYYEDKDDKEFDKEIKESDLTGYYKGKMTMDYQKFLQDMGFKQEEAIREAEYNKARIEKIYNDVELGWEKLKNDDIKLAQAAQRIGISAGNLKLNKEKYASSILEKAQDMTTQYFKDSENFEDYEDITGNQYEKKMRYFTDYLQGNISENEMTEEDKKIINNGMDSGDLK